MEPCIQTPILPASRFDDTIRIVSMSGVMTPPDSPTKESVAGQDDASSSEAEEAMMDSSIVTEGSVVYPVSEIRAMSDELAQARGNREFPHTSASSRDAQVVVEDYEDLMKLRQARCRHSEHASEEYRQLLVEVARRIKERDAALDEAARNLEASRRVESYLRSVEQERQCFDAAKALIQRRPAQSTQVDLDDVGEEIFSIIEKAAEQTMADASGPLRLNIGNLRSEAADFKDQNDAFSRQNDTLSRQNDTFNRHNDALSRQTDVFSRQNELYNHQIDLHYHVLEQQSTSISALQSMFEPQAKNIEATTEQLNATAEQLLQAGDLVASLSHIVMNLPSAVNQVVHTAVQNQTQDAFRDMLEAQQRVVLDLEKRSRQVQAMFLEVEAARLQLEKRERDLGSVHLSGSRSQELGTPGSRGKLRNMMKKVFRNH